MRTPSRRHVVLFAFGALIAGLVWWCPRQPTTKEVQADQDWVEWNQLWAERSRLLAEIRVLVKATGEDRGGVWVVTKADSEPYKELLGKMKEVGDISRRLSELHTRHPDWPLVEEIEKEIEKSWAK